MIEIFLTDISLMSSFSGAFSMVKKTGHVLSSRKPNKLPIPISFYWGIQNIHPALCFGSFLGWERRGAKSLYKPGGMCKFTSNHACSFLIKHSLKKLSHDEEKFNKNSLTQILIGLNSVILVFNAWSQPCSIRHHAKYSKHSIIQIPWNFDHKSVSNYNTV